MFKAALSKARSANLAGQRTVIIAWSAVRAPRRNAF